MLKIQSDRVIIDGHEPTKEQCETMTLLANALAESNNFKIVEYRDGYAEFEKVGKADELKFVLDGPGSFSMYDSSTGDEVFYVASDGDMTITFSGNELTLTAQGDFSFTLKRSNTSYVESYSPSDGSGGGNTPIVITMKKQIESINDYTITFAESSVATKVSVDLTTLSGWSSLSSGSHSITIVAKAENYRDSEPSAAVSVEKAAAGFDVTLSVTENISNIIVMLNDTIQYDISDVGTKTFNNVNKINLTAGDADLHITNSTGSFIDGTYYTKEFIITSNSSCSIRHGY